MWTVAGELLLVLLALVSVSLTVLFISLRRKVKTEDRKRSEAQERWDLELERKRQNFLAHEKQEMEECERRVLAIHPEYADPPWPPLTHEEFNKRMERMEAKHKAVAELMFQRTRNQ